MCIVSAVSSEYWQQKPFIPMQTWPKQDVIDLAEVIKRLDRIDKHLGLKDCKDEEKSKFLAELDKLVQKYGVVSLLEELQSQANNVDHSFVTTNEKKIGFAPTLVNTQLHWTDGWKPSELVSPSPWTTKTASTIGTSRDEGSQVSQNNQNSQLGGQRIS